MSILKMLRHGVREKGRKMDGGMLKRFRSYFRRSNPNPPLLNWGNYPSSSRFAKLATCSHKVGLVLQTLSEATHPAEMSSWSLSLTNPIVTNCDGCRWENDFGAVNGPEKGTLTLCLLLLWAKTA